MKELNYTPNELARNLYHKRTGIIAVLVPNVLNPFLQNSSIMQKQISMRPGLR